jgi:hypothetical protein
MTRYSITLERNALGHMSANSIGTDALNAISSIPGTTDVQIESESKGQVEISYAWTGSDKFWATQEHLSKFNLRRVGW